MRISKLARLSRTFSSALLCSLAIVIGYTAAPTANAASGTQPFFKVFGGSVFTGGAFEASGSGCATNYQSSSPGGNAAGGILAFSKQLGVNYVGASSQYDAYATGPVDYNNSYSYGFFTGGGRNSLTFANHTPPAGTLGGYFDGSQTQSDCIPDYFDPPHRTILSPDISGNVNLNSLAAGQHYSTGDITITNAATIAAGKDLTVFVKGNVYISKDIIYGSFTDTSIPKFALVVEGNIFVDPGVHTLDGLYIAQPQNPGDTTNGIFWSCHDGTAGSENQADWSAWVARNCDKTSGNAPSLTINGALIARQVNFMRTNGDVSSANPSENSLSGAQGSKNVSELVNYNPSMVIDGGFFNQSPPTYRIDSLTSLPPIF